MSFDGFFVRALVAELKEQLGNGRIHKIYQPKKWLDRNCKELSDVIFESYDSSPSENSTALSIELKSGEVIDNIIFGVERFFIRSGPVSAPLSNDDIDTLNEILKIRR